MYNADVTEWYVSWGKLSDDSCLRKWLFTEFNGAYHFWDKDREYWCDVSDLCLIRTLEAELNDILWEAYEAE